MRSPRTDVWKVSATDRVGNGIVAGFIATFVMSIAHEPLTLLTASVGMRAPASGLLFHFFVGTLLWGGLFGFLHDYLIVPSWLRGVMFASAGALVVFLAIAPLTGAGFFCLNLGAYAPIVVVLFHAVYGAILGAAYGKLVDTDEARDHIAGHAHR